MGKEREAEKIVIVSQSHLCRNPRVVKEAITLSLEGYQVIILTAIYAENLYREDLEIIKAYDISYEFYSDLRKRIIGNFTERATRRIAMGLQFLFRMESVLSLGFNPNHLFKKCVGYDADCYIMHQELATYTGIKLMKAGFKVVFDLEDWYSEDLLPQARRKRPNKLLKKMELNALRSDCITTSFALAEQLAISYQTHAAVVIYNVFPLRVNLLKENDINTPLKLFWFSQTIGAGRGLEQFIQVLQKIVIKVELHLLGYISDNYRKELEVLMPKQHGLYFHQLVGSGELADKTAEFDIGLALELQSPPSRDLTITNKFFQYLQSGLPVIASDTKGQNEVFEKFKPGFQLSQTPTAEEIAALNSWLNDSAALKLAKKNAMNAAFFYNWENESKKLIKLVKNIVDHAG